MATLEETIDARLNAIAGLAALVGARIYRAARARGSILPAIVYTRISRTVVNHAGGQTDTQQARFQVDVYADADTEVQQIADLVKGETTGGTPSGLSGWTHTGEAPYVTSCLLLSEIAGDEPGDTGAEDSRVFRRIQDYALWFNL